MNVLTFDIEEWYIEREYHGDRIEQYRKFDSLLDRLLDELDELGIKATFFCLGEMARYFPAVVSRINDRGHEIGCHSNRHDWLTKLSRAELAADTEAAICALEDLTGRKVVSYRAPAFSVCKDNAWALEVLASCGIRNDASIFPAARDFGGFPDFAYNEPVTINTGGFTIREFPISPADVIGKKIAFSGGGYFRLFPLGIINRFMRRMDYVMLYFHIGDLSDETKSFMSRTEYEEYFKENGSFKNRAVRYFKANTGTRGAMDKLGRLLHSHAYCNLAEANSIIDWGSRPVIEL